MQKPEQQDQSREFNAHRIVIRVLLVLMAVEWILLLLDQRWLSLFLVTFIIGTVFSPILFRSRMQVEIPAEFHLTAVIFIFASFYLGEVQDFYQRLWWWDIALHTTAGLLMGILGFLLVYILNESKRVELNMNPGFIAFFAFTFALAIGSVWEIFEFGMDQFFGMNMQKPMLGDPSGLTDTMWDIIVNALGAFVISFSGFIYLKRKESFFVKKWIRSFIEKNPGMFKS
ncbi:hypothetical protein [Gracilimonas halophila]|uniref:Membrane protein YjdF n=1 Tax=Gracilimonas halophila TaxID=1834464 RepID=A0ABW5JL18_9BACT